MSTWREEAAAMVGTFVKFDLSDSATVIIVVEDDTPKKVPSSFRESKQEYHFEVVWNTLENAEKGEEMIPGTWSIGSRYLLKTLAKIPDLMGARLKVKRSGYGPKTVYDVTEEVDG